MVAIWSTSKLMLGLDLQHGEQSHNSRFTRAVCMAVLAGPPICLLATTTNFLISLGPIRAPVYIFAASLLLLAIGGVIVGRRPTMATASVAQRHSAGVAIAWQTFKRSERSKRLAVLGGITISFVLIGLFSDFHSNLPETVGSPAILFLWGSSACVLFFPLAYLSHFVRVPIILLTVLAAFTFSLLDLNDNHEVRRIDDHDLAHGEGAEFRGGFPQIVGLRDWFDSRPDAKEYDYYPLIVTAIEGGGLRAGYFSAQFLAALQDLCPSFSTHTFAISGVSGGSVGAAVFAGLSTTKANSPAVRCYLEGVTEYPLRDAARRVLATDLLSPVLAAMLFPDALQRIVPWPIPSWDRARALEFRLERAWKDGVSGMAVADDFLTRPLGNIWSDDKSPRVPHLVLNVTSVSTGFAHPISTAWLPDLDMLRELESAFQYERQAAPLTLDTIAGEIERMPLSSAALLSARFPYITPAGRITTGGVARRFVDGGYFENSGAGTITDIAGGLFLHKVFDSKNCTRPGANCNSDQKLFRQVQIEMLLIRTNSCTSLDRGIGCQEDRHADSEVLGLGETLSPFRTIRKTGEAHASVSRMQSIDLPVLVKTICLFGSAGGVEQKREPRELDECQPDASRQPQSSYPINVSSIVLTNDSETTLPLTWLLSNRARKKIDQVVDEAFKIDFRTKNEFIVHPESNIGAQRKTVANIACSLYGWRRAVEDGFLLCEALLDS